MISVEQAKQLLKTYRPDRRTVHSSVGNALGKVLSEDVHAPIPMPPFRQSAMDGYALGRGATRKHAKFKVIGEVPAGSSTCHAIKSGEAMRIFTGAPVPEGSISIVQQEWTARSDETITLLRDVGPAMNIRKEGGQIKKGDVALPSRTRLTPAAVGFLRMLGITDVEVFATPTVKILVTGNELAQPGHELRPGQIYESNSFMLLAALAKEGVEVECERVSDNLNETVDKIASALAGYDMLILSGGISVGDHDHVRTAMDRTSVESIFYKVAQKPGKPLFFGLKGKQPVFALPGNPAACLTCFYEYVLPIVRDFSGRNDVFLTSTQLPLISGKTRTMDRSQFLKALVANNGVSLLDGQSSAMLNTFSLANALVHIPANSPEKNPGDTVDVHLLP